MILGIPYQEKNATPAVIPRLGALASAVAVAIFTAGWGIAGNLTGSSCKNNNTASLELANKSSRSTYDALLDGARVATLGPGASFKRDVAAGAHTTDFLFSNTGRQACATAHPVLAQCEATQFSCSADL